jgi:hypothetical protein
MGSVDASTAHSGAITIPLEQQFIVDRAEKDRPYFRAAIVSREAQWKGGGGLGEGKRQAGPPRKNMQARLRNELSDRRVRVEPPLLINESERRRIRSQCGLSGRLR